MRLEDTPALGVCLLDDAGYFRVNGLCGGLGKGLLDLVGVIIEKDEADLFGHAPLSYHAAGRLGDFAEIVATAGSDCWEVEFLGDAAAKGHGHAVEELFHVHEVFIARKVLRVAKGGLATWDNGDFEKRVGVLEEPAADSMSRLMICYNLFLVGLKNKRLALETANYSLNGTLKVNLFDRLGIDTSSYALLAS